MKILLFGKNGQVGNALERNLLSLGKVYALGRNDLDLQDFSRLHNVLYEYAPDIIINAAAYTAVDRAESEESVAYAINSMAVAVMAQYAFNLDILLVHYSTDYVFDGKKNGAYIETDVTNPLNIYAKSKRAGEEAILTSHCRALIFRTSWIFSAHGFNFIKTILRLGKERESMRIVADQYGAPTSAEFIAQITKEAIVAYYNNALQSGIYHLTSSGETTWYHLACFSVQHAREIGIELKLNVENIVPVATEEYPLPAKRPHNSRLNTKFLENALGLRFPDWKIDVTNTINLLHTEEYYRTTGECITLGRAKE